MILVFYLMYGLLQVLVVLSSDEEEPTYKNGRDNVHVVKYTCNLNHCVS